MTVDTFNQMEIIETYRPCSDDGWHGSTVCVLLSNVITVNARNCFLITAYYFYHSCEACGKFFAF